jgi:hypothetical protein
VDLFNVGTCPASNELLIEVLIPEEGRTLLELELLTELDCKLHDPISIPSIPLHIIKFAMFMCPLSSRRTPTLLGENSSCV